MKKLTFIFLFISSLLTSCVNPMASVVSLEFKSKEYNLKAGQKYDLFYELNIANSSEEPVFTSSEEAVATVTPEGLVVALAAGRTTITATLGNVSASCVVKVTIDKAESVNIKSVAPTLVEGFWSEVTAEVLPLGYDLSNMRWTITAQPEELVFEYEKVDACTYNIKVAEWIDGAKVIVTVNDTKSTTSRKKEFAVDRKPIVGAVGLKASPAELVVPVGTAPFELQSKIYPEDYHKAILSYSSSDEAVVKVKSGVLTFLSIGTADITVTDPISGLSDVCKVTVKDTPAPVAEITSVLLDKVYVSKDLGDPAFQLIATCKNGQEEVPYYDLQWGIKSGGDNVIEVSQLGVVTIKDVDAQSAGVSTVEVYDRKKPLQVRAACQVSVSGGEVKVTSVNVPSIRTVKEGESFDIEAVVTPNNAADKRLIYKSSDETIATVSDNGIVTGVASGETVITVVTSNGISAECIVQVVSSRVPVSKVNLEISNLNLSVGQSYTLTAVVTPENATEKTVTWESSNSDVATVNDGKVEAKSNGKVKITALVDGKKAVCEVTVSDDVQSVDQLTEIAIIKKETIRLALTATGSLVWRVRSGAEYVSLDPETGFLVAKAVGEAVVEAVVAGEVQKALTVKVQPLYPKSISIDPVQCSVSKGSYRQLECVFNPIDCDYRDVVWKSSNPTVATVENGLLTAHEVGTVRVTAETADGKLSTFAMVTVEAPKHQVVLKYMDAHVEANGLKQEESTRLKAYYYGEDSSTPYSPLATQWLSSDESLAVVDQEGRVTNVAESLTSAGAKVTITHVADGVRKSIEIKLTRASAKSVRIVNIPADNVIYYDDQFTFKAVVEPAKAEQVVKWMGAPGKIDYDTGVYIANTIGYATVTAYAYEDGKNEVRTSYSFEVKYRDITKAELNYTSQTMKAGQSMILSVDIQPLKGTNKSIVWESSNPEVATVSGGKVRALREGNAVIKAILSNGTVLTCSLVVEASDLVYKVGDYYYSDGTTSSVLDPSKKLIGVIFAIDNVTFSDSKLGEDYPHCINGLVVCTEGLTGTFGYFSYPDSNPKGVANYIKESGAELSREASNGYSLTKAYGGYRETYPDDSYCLMFDKTTGLAASYAAQGYVADNASTWYVPSYNEMMLLYQNKAVVNEALKAASAEEIQSDGYLTSTLWTTRWEGRNYDDCSARLFDMATGTWGGFFLSTSERPARLILAF